MQGDERAPFLDARDVGSDGEGDDAFIPEVSDLEPADGMGQRLRFWSARGLVGQGLTPRQRLWRMGTAGAVITLALLIITVSATGNPLAALFSRRSAPPLILQPQSQDGLCFNAAAWAPDSKQVALLGSDIDCSTFGARHDVLATYDASSGQQLTLFYPDGFVLNALPSATHLVSSPVQANELGHTSLISLNYHALLWSPNGSRLALPFYVVVKAAAGAIGVSGVLLIAPNGAHAEVLFQPLSDKATLAEWDLQAGERLPVPAVLQQTEASTESITLALRYRWGAHGDITIAQPLPADGKPPPLSAIGSPTGNTTFTLWQPGGAQRATYFDGEHTNTAYAFGTYFMAWSPDGRYLLDAFALGGWMTLPSLATPDAYALQGMELGQQPQLPLRDAGLQHALSTLTSDQQQLLVAWRPDGLALATTLTGSGVTIYGCRSGRTLATLLTPSATSSHTGFAPISQTILSWSPDGSHLLLAGGSVGSALIWGPDQLPS